MSLNLCHHRMSASQIIPHHKKFRGAFLSICVGLLCSVLLACSAQRVAEQPATKEKKSQSPQTLGIQSAIQPATLSSAVQDGKAKDYFIKGSSFQMQEKYADAILEFQQALRYDNNPIIHFALAQNYNKLNKQELAQEHLHESIALDSGFVPALKLLAESYMAMVKIDEAIQLYTIINQREPDVQNVFTLARLYEFRNPDKAIEMYLGLLKESPAQEINSTIILSQLAKLYGDKGNNKQLINVLEQIHENVPDDVFIADTLMGAYLSTKQYSKAFMLLQNLEKRLPEGHVITLSLLFGNTLFLTIDADTTISSLAAQFVALAESRTKSGFTNSAEYQLVCGMLSGKLRNIPQSKWFFERSLALGDSTIIIPLQIGYYYFQQHQFDQALAVLGRYSGKFPTNAQLFFMKGLCYSQLDSSRLAVEELKTTVNIDPKHVDAWSQLGMLYNSSGMQAKSDSAYEMVLKIDPENALVNNNYAYSFSERNIELDRAEKMVSKSLKAEPLNPSYLDTMGWILYRKGKYQQALEFIQKAIDNGEASATIFEHLGDTHQQLGNTEKAYKAWQEALRKDPNRNSTKERLLQLSQQK